MQESVCLLNRQFSFRIAIGIVLLGLAVVACDLEASTESDMVAFVDVNVLPMTQNGEKILEDHTVLVQGEQVSAIGPSDELEVPDDAVRIDGKGQYLIPGLTEMHGHIPGYDDPEYMKNILFLYVSNGVTTVRGMAGHPYHLELRERIKRGELLAPSIYTASPWLGEDDIPAPDDAAHVVGKYKESGYDLLKVGSISPESYVQMARMANEVNIPFAGHIPAGVGLERALAAGQASIDHYDRYVEFLVSESANMEGRNAGFFGSGLVALADTSRIPEAVDMTIGAGTWNVPTLSLVEHLASPESPEQMIQRPEMRYMPKEILDNWVEAKHNFQNRDDFQLAAAQRLVELRRQLTKSLHDAGAPLALGSDAPQFFNVPGFSIHHEMKMMAAAGLTPYEVLVTGTRNPAVYFDAAGKFGTIEADARADLILLEANPLEDISNAQKRAGVMVRGKWLPEEEIQQRLAEIAKNVKGE